MITMLTIKYLPRADEIDLLKEQSSVFNCVRSGVDRLGE